MPNKCNQAVLSASSDKLAAWLQQASSTQILSVLVVCSQKGRFRLLQNISRAAFEQLLQAVATESGLTWQPQWQQQPTSVFDILDTNLASLKPDNQTCQQLQNLVDSPKVCTFSQPQNIKEFINQAVQLLKLTVENGFSSLEASQASINNRLLNQCAQAALQANDSISLDNLLDAVCEQHLQEENIKCQIARKALVEVFGSCDPKMLQAELEKLVPFLP